MVDLDPLRRRGTPNGYGVYEISGSTVPNQYYKATNKAADHQIRAYSAKQVFGTSAARRSASPPTPRP